MKYVLIKVGPCSKGKFCDQESTQIGEPMKGGTLYTESNAAFRQRASANNEAEMRFSCKCEWDVKEIEE